VGRLEGNPDEPVPSAAESNNAGSTPVVSGLLVVDKPAGCTSHDVVGRVRRLARTRKVGHAGTLDPMATGVLLLGLNRATRLLGHLALAGKVYRAGMRFGVATVTDDAEGEVVSTVDAGALTDADVRAAIAAQVGDIDQVPSSVSAIKVDGRRAYARVRAGEDVELAARRVRVERIDVLHRRHARLGDVQVLDVDVEVSCSSGTYVRALARDIGVSLGVGGHLTALRRTAVGPFGERDAHSLEALAPLPAGALPVLPIGEVAARFFLRADVSVDTAEMVRVGRRVPGMLSGIVADGAPDPVAVFGPAGEFLALYRSEGTTARPVAVFV